MARYAMTDLLVNGKLGVFFDNFIVLTKVIGFFAWIKRPFAVDMAGFAVNLDYFLSFPDAKFLPTKGKLETNFLQQLVTIDELEPKADNCSKVSHFFMQLDF